MNCPKSPARFFGLFRFHCWHHEEIKMVAVARSAACQKPSEAIYERSVCCLCGDPTAWRKRSPLE